MTLWVKVEQACNVSYYFRPEDVVDAQDVGDNTGDNIARIEMLFNNMMTDFFCLRISRRK